MRASNTMSSRVEIQVLGSFRLRVAGTEVTSLPEKAQALLSYLAMRDSGLMLRETVSDLLWTDRGAEQARHSLRQSLYVLGKQIPGALGGGVKHLALMPAVVDTDIGRFRELAKAGDRASLAEAAALLTGGLLDGFQAIFCDFDDWLATARSEVTDEAIGVLGRLSDSCLAEGDVHPAVVAAERALALDTLREDSHRRLMEAYARAGRRSDAVRQYELCVEILRRDLDVAPSAETEGLAREIRIDRPSETPDDIIATTPPILRVFTGPPRIAVLPLETRGGQSLPEHVSDGLVEDVIAQLAGLRDVNVISFGSTRRFRDRNTDLAEVGRELDVQYAVRGIVRRSGPSVRISTELTNARDGTVIWTRNYDTGVTLSFDDQDRIVGQVVNTLTPRVIEAELLRIRGKRTESLTVYEKALLARNHLSQLGQEHFSLAHDLMTQVMAEDPAWGEAYALAADCHGLLLAEGWSGERDHHITKIDRLSTKALALDRDNVRALTFFAHRKTIFHRDYQAAKDLFRRALEAAPGSAQAWLWSGYTYAYAGDATDAIRRAERALALSPSDREIYWFYLGLCIAYYSAGIYDSAADWARLALSEPEVGRTGRIWAAAAFAAAGRMTEAADAARWVHDNWPERSVRSVVAQSPYQDPVQRRIHGEHLSLAGFPD
jgi:DNA-binding SARP family transcriptional activator